jgi:hypothetical protein
MCSIKHILYVIFVRGAPSWTFWIFWILPRLAQNKTPRRESGEAQVMGGFPKEKQKFYTKFMPLLLAPPM